MAPSTTMTLLFTDLVGSTAMGDRLGDDHAEAVRRRFFHIIEEAVAPTGGRIVKTLGDGHMVAFASALDAIGCAIAIQHGVDMYNSEDAEQIGVRVGINAGDVTVEGDDYFGTPVTIAKRLCDSAEGGQILVSGLVESLVGSRGSFAFRTLGALDLRGLSRPQAASEVVWRGDLGDVRAVTVAPPPARSESPARRRPAVAALLTLAAVAVAATGVVAVLALTGDDSGRDGTAGATSTPVGPTLTSSSVSGSTLVDLTGELPTIDSVRDFGFSGEAGDVVRIDGTRRQQEVDLVLELRGPDGSLLAFDDDTGQTHEPQITAELPTTGDYSVVVRMFAPESNGGFHLQVRKLPDSTRVATDRLYGEFTTPGSTFETPVELEQGQTIDVVTRSESVNVADLYLELVGPDGEVAASDDDSGEYADPVIQGFEVPTGGTWTIRISPREEADLGAFWVEVRPAA